MMVSQALFAVPQEKNLFDPSNSVSNFELQPGDSKWLMAVRTPITTTISRQTGSRSLHLRSATKVELMVLKRIRNDCSQNFRDLHGADSGGDAIVLNTTRVYRARLLGTRDSGAPAEVLLLKPLGDGRYEAMVHPAASSNRAPRSCQPGSRSRDSRSNRTTHTIVKLAIDTPLDEAIERFGHVPLPPYITRADEAPDFGAIPDVYAQQSGSVAAPTAGLHFTDDLLQSSRSAG
jgi:S-adenosylmethionine:tRNA ribosyltransferase-isomerase